MRNWVIAAAVVVVGLGCAPEVPEVPVPDEIGAVGDEVNSHIELRFVGPGADGPEIEWPEPLRVEPSEVLDAEVGEDGRVRLRIAIGLGIVEAADRVEEMVRAAGWTDIERVDVFDDGVRMRWVTPSGGVGEAQFEVVDAARSEMLVVTPAE